MSDLALFKSQLQESTASPSEALDSVISSADFWPYISIMGPNSDPVKEQKIPMGHLGLRVKKDVLIDLGKTQEMFVIDCRTKALDIRNREAPIAFYDVNGEGYQKLVAIDNATTTGMSNVLWGTEFFVWLPFVQRADNEGPTFATFFFSTATLRRKEISKTMRALIGSLALIQTKLIKNKSYSWFGLEIPVTSNTPLENIPEEEIMKQRARFRETTVDPVVEVAQPAASDRPR